MDDQRKIEEKLAEMRTEHQDLNAVIDRLLAEGGGHDQLQLQRLKKRKLLLKDMIAKYEGLLHDDIIA